MNSSHRKLIAVVGAAASLALPVAAYAQATQSSSPAAATARVGNHPRIDFAAIATELKLPVEQVRTAFHDNRPAKTGTRPTQAQRDAALAATATQLGVSAAELKSLVSEYGGGAGGTMGAAAGARQKGPSAAAVAAKLSMPVATVTAAMKTAHDSVASITDRVARKTAFQAAVATNLGVSTTSVNAAFTSVQADKLSACVTKLVAKGTLSATQADSIRAQIAAGDLDAAHAAIDAAKQAS